MEGEDISRNDTHKIMLLFENFEVKDVETEPDNFEDITDLIFSTVDDKLKDTEMLCHHTFSFDETMSAFEAMDDKMDLRKNRGRPKMEGVDILK